MTCENICVEKLTVYWFPVSMRPSPVSMRNVTALFLFPTVPLHPVECSFSFPTSVAPSEFVSNQPSSLDTFAPRIVYSRFLASPRHHTRPATCTRFTSPSFAPPSAFLRLSMVHSGLVLAGLLHPAATSRLLLFRGFFLNGSRSLFRKTLPPCRYKHSTVLLT
jgi:hypothetical protein